VVDKTTVELENMSEEEYEELFKGESEPVENKLCDVVLSNVGYEEVDLIRILRKVTEKNLEEIKSIISSLPVTICKNISTNEAEKIKNQLSAIGASVRVISAKKSLSNNTNEESKQAVATANAMNNKDGGITKIKKNFKPFFIAIDIVIVVALICFFCSGKSSIMINDFLASDYGRDFVDYNPYIQMVRALKPYDNTSYGEAFSNEFDNNEWSYSKSDGMRIVQIVSTYNDINDKMITQFLLTPQEDNKFLIEPYAVNVSGVNLSDIERDMVIAALFKGDLSQVLFESLLYGNQEDTFFDNSSTEEAKITQEKDDKEEYINGLETRISEIENKISDIYANIDSCNNRIVLAETQIQKDKDLIVEHEKTISQLQNSSDDYMNSQIRDYNQYIENCRRAIEKNEMVIQTENNRINQYNEDILELETKKVELSKELNEQKS